MSVTTSLAEAEQQAGRPLTLNDTYDDRGNKHLKHGASATAGKSSISGQQCVNPALSPRSSTHPVSRVQLPGSPHKPAEETPALKKKHRPHPLQSRPWPPAALEGTPLLSGSGQSMSFGRLPTPQLPRTAIESTFQARAANDRLNRPLSAMIPSMRIPIRPRNAVPLVDASTFMSRATNIMASRSQSKTQETLAGTSLSDTASPIIETPANPQQEAGDKVTKSPHSEPGIRKVPVAEFTFSATTALATTQTSTHTDGAPSSAALSGFSPSVESERPVKGTNVFQHVAPLVGLGIQGAGLENVTSTRPSLPPSPLPTGLSSDTGSLLDSPILEDMSGSVLVANKSNEKDVVVIDGIRYIPESRLLALKQSIKKHGISLRDDARSPVAQEEVPLIKPELPTRPVMAARNEPASTVANVSTKVVNPFEPRDLAPEEASDQVVPQAVVSRPPQILQGPSRTLDEALVAAVNSPLAALLAQVPAKPPAKAKSTKHAIVSKWAAPPGEVYTSHPLSKDISQIDPVESEPADTSSQVKQPVLQSKSTNGSRSGKKAKKNPFEAKLAGVESESASSAGESAATAIIGDRNAIKPSAQQAAKSSKSAAAATAAASRSASKRQYEAPGPGYALLLAELVQKEPSNAGSTVEDESDEEEL